MPDSRSGISDHSLNTIDVLRRNYGRRYSGLPVDTIDRESFTIDCTHSYMRPSMFDVRPGDTVRWMKNGRYLQGQITHVERTDTSLRALLEKVEPLPQDFFPW